jgi:hypothetical protein
MAGPNTPLVMNNIGQDDLDKRILETEKLMKELSHRKNYASKDSGATILHKSSGVKNPKSILSGNRDEYLILPSCKKDEVYTLIINLSEDVAIDNIVISNHEEFSDNLEEIEFMGSIDYPPDKWVRLGSIFPKAGLYHNYLSVEMEDN